jgi:hypothetical protein
MTQAYPLQWPSNRPRAAYQTASKFIVPKSDGSKGARTIDGAIQILLKELKLLGAEKPVISSNAHLRGDGLPYSGQAQPQDRGVAVYFSYKKRDMCFASDRWDKIQDNIYGIAKTIEALRGIERWGSGSMVEQAFTGFVAIPAPKSPWEIIGIPPGASSVEIDAAFRAKAKKLHSDAGGDDAAIAELNAARAKLKEQAA